MQKVRNKAFWKSWRVAKTVAQDRKRAYNQNAPTGVMREDNDDDDDDDEDDDIILSINKAVT